MTVRYQAALHTDRRAASLLISYCIATGKCPRMIVCLFVGRFGHFILTLLRFFSCCC